jgi:hypothetical protein
MSMMVHSRNLGVGNALCDDFALRLQGEDFEGQHRRPELFMENRRSKAKRIRYAGTVSLLIIKLIETEF